MNEQKETGLIEDISAGLGLLLLTIMLSAKYAVTILAMLPFSEALVIVVVLFAIAIITSRIKAYIKNRV